VHGPGSAAVGAVVGLTLVALAVLLIADRQTNLDLSVGLTAAGIGVALAGLGIMIAGIRGRRSGSSPPAATGHQPPSRRHGTASPSVSAT